MLDYPITDPSRQAKLIEWLRLHRNRHLTVMWDDERNDATVIRRFTRKWDNAPDPFDMGPMSEEEKDVLLDAAAHPLEPIGKWSLRQMEIHMKEGRSFTGGDAKDVIASGVLHLAYVQDDCVRYYVHPDHAEFWADCVEKMGGRCPFDGPETEDGVDPNYDPLAWMLGGWDQLRAHVDSAYDKALAKHDVNNLDDAGRAEFFDDLKRLLDQHGNPI